MKRTRRRIVHPLNSPFASPKAVTQQHMKVESDINTIVAKARRGIPPTNIRQDGRFADLSNAPEDLTDAFGRVQNAIDLFEQLPAKARQELGNDPRRLLEATPEFMVRHGLAKALQEPSVDPAPGQGASGGTEPPQAPKGPKKAVKPAQPDETQDV